MKANSMPVMRPRCAPLMDHRPRLALGFWALSTAALIAQAPDPDLQKFQSLGARQQAAIVRQLERSLGQSGDPLALRAAGLGCDLDDLPAARTAEPVFGDDADAAADYLNAMGPRDRRPYPPNAKPYLAAKQRFERAAFLPDLRREVDYDWLSGAIVRTEPHDYVDLFANALAGYPPYTDHAVARILAALDRDQKQRQYGWYFAHRFCDLAARSYPGITLYDAWYSGEIIDIPDVDAVPFGWRILGQRQHVSPLGGAPRERLYEDIRAAVKLHRVHRTTIEAAAAAFVSAEPNMDPLYALLVPRFHYLFATHGDDPAAIAALLSESSRDKLLAEVDRAIKLEDGEAFVQREARKAELAASKERIRGLAKSLLQRIGGG